MSRNLKIDINKLTKTVALSSGEQIRSIMSVLKSHFNITHYCYIRSFKDGTHLLLSNDSTWIEKFYLDFYEHGAFHKVPDSYHSGHMLWSTAQDQTTFNACRENFNIDYGITIIEKQKNFCEFYCFGTTRDNPQIIEFYLNNLDLLKRFNTFFKEKASTLIEKANEDRLILPNCYNISDEIIPKLVYPDETRKNFIHATQCKRYYLSGHYSNIYLTARELDCLNLITFGKTIKEIARILSLSARTVETHLNTVKMKLNTTSKAGLILKSLQHNQYRPFNEKQFLSNREEKIN